MLNVAYTVDILHQDGDPGEVTVSTKVDEDSGEAIASNKVVERRSVSTMDGDQTFEMLPNSVAEAERGAAGADLEDQVRGMRREISQLRRLISNVNQGK